MPGYIRRRGERRRKDGTIETTWQLTIDHGRDPLTGRRRREFVKIRGSRKEAEEALVKALRQRDKGIDIVPNRLTVSDCLYRWLRDEAARNVQPSTLERYEELIDHHLKPALGSIPLKKLQPAHIQEAYAKFRRLPGRGDQRGDRLSPKTEGHIHALLKQALGWAVRMRLIAVNPSDAVKRPKASRPEMRVLNRDDVRALRAAARETPWYPLLYLALHTGARIGELLALRWQEVDLDRGSIQIVRTQRFFKGQGIVAGQPKTARSRRPIAMSPDAAAVLVEHRRLQLEHRLVAGPAYDNRDLVFADGIGRPVYDSTVRRSFYAIVRQAGLPHLRIHDLRHTAATLMLQAGVNAKVVSERLGHAKVAFTLDTYSHVLPDMQREAAAALDAVLSGSVIRA
jgi:integrase